MTAKMVESQEQSYVGGLGNSSCLLMIASDWVIQPRSQVSATPSQEYQALSSMTAKSYGFQDQRYPMQGLLVCPLKMHYDYKIAIIRLIVVSEAATMSFWATQVQARNWRWILDTIA